METFFYLKVHTSKGVTTIGPYLNFRESVVLATDYIDKIMVGTYKVDPSSISSISVEEWCLTPDGQLLLVAIRLTEERHAAK